MTGVGSVTVSIDFHQTPQHVGDQNFYQCDINGVKFAFFCNVIACQDSLTLDLRDYNIVLLAPILVEGDILIRAISMIAFSTICSNKGNLTIELSGKAIMLGTVFQSDGSINIRSRLDQVALPIYSRRRDLIIGSFNEGIATSNARIIGGTMLETFDAVQDPEGKLPQGHAIRYADAFPFFGIPLNS